MSPGEIKRVPAGAPWGERVGYCRALRVGNQIFVSGTVGVGENGQAPAGAYAQARQALNRIEKALGELGAQFSQVVRTRMFVTRIADWEEIGRAHAEVFGSFPPATSMVEVSALIGPDFLVEIEVDALVVDRTS
jgi:enamine deaminase RidA (YjgF/YER057c/UK114 family)